MSEAPDRGFKAGYVALVGRPNVGKSTLTNKLLKFPLSIVTPKPQTTRHRILGILSGENFQIVLLDTPGIIEPAYLLQTYMMKSARSAVQDADLMLFIIEAAAKVDHKDVAILTSFQAVSKPVILVINKIDLLDKALLLPLIDDYNKRHEFKDIVPLSALYDDNLSDLQNVILRHLPCAEPLYPVDMVTEHPERFFVSEIIREKIFQNYGEEVPYSTAVVIDEFRERPDHKDFIKARIIVERDSQKGILIGKGGKALKNVGQQARENIEKFLGRQVYLELWVAVREKWRSNETFVKEFGYHGNSK
jgi:GTPase